MLAPSEVDQQYLVNNTVSWVEQCHQVDPMAGELTELARQWRAELKRAPERFLTPLGPRLNTVGAMAAVPEKCSGRIVAR
eukprot:137848-Alexandrium_andersonii.AAC.1